MSLFEIDYFIDNGYREDHKTTFIVAHTQDDAEKMLQERCDKNDWVLKSIDDCREHDITDGIMIDRRGGWVENV